MVQAVILEDHTLYRLGVKYVFDHSPDIILAGEANCDAELFQILAGTSADIVLVGVNLFDDIAYTDITRRIRHDFPTVKILAIANEDTAEIVQSMTEAGIHGYIGKRQASKHELTKAVQMVAEGREYAGKIDTNIY